MKILVEIKTIYGVQKIYPVCDNAKLFTSMLGQTTLTERDIKFIKQLGYQIEVYQPEVKL